VRLFITITVYAGPLSISNCVSIESIQFRLLNMISVFAAKIPDYLQWAFG
jgi:hypothetical protein